MGSGRPLPAAVTVPQLGVLQGRGRRMGSGRPLPVSAVVPQLGMRPVGRQARTVGLRQPCRCASFAAFSGAVRLNLDRRATEWMERRIARAWLRAGPTEVRTVRVERMERVLQGLRRRPAAQGSVRYGRRSGEQHSPESKLSQPWPARHVGASERSEGLWALRTVLPMPNLGVPRGCPVAQSLALAAGV